ncbi:hypothetical protein [Actinocorallia longicatena]|uniref:Uncharacterized protein n=1 Tax=Actinocorallia longicatena TaxID=111803 RepID=A0ABP6Q864_9ACTN
MLLAHGVGGRQDLPIPLAAALTGAVLALLLSFVALGLLWKEPRLGGVPETARTLPRRLGGLVSGPGWAWTWRITGLVMAAYFCVGLLFGPDDPANPTAGTFYVLFWVGLVPLSLLFGPVWRTLNPLRTVHLLGSRAFRRDEEKGLRPLPPWLGHWPAAVGLFGFVWLELVAPERATLPVIRTWLAVYCLAMLAGAVVFGSQWFDRGDAFEAYSGLIGRLSPVGLRRDGVLCWRNPLDGMAELRPAPGLTVLVVVLLGSTMYDSLSGSADWVVFVQESSWPAPVWGTIGLLTVIGLVLAAFTAATGLADTWGAVMKGSAVVEFAPAVVPIAAGYLIAHYFTLLLFEGQRTIVRLGDPLVTGTNPLGGTDRPLNGLGTTPASIAMLQVTVIVLGHVLGTVLAHDRALALFPRRGAVLGQTPLLGLMTAYTSAGLFLLFAA